jgi:hypothetical protein
MYCISRRWLETIATVGVVVSVLAFGACGNDDDDVDPGHLTVSVAAEVVEPDAAASVEATALRDAGEGRLAHEVRVTWEADAPAILDDARFTHWVEEGAGHLVLAGRGCGADWEEASEQVVHVCTADIQLVWLEPGQSHDYPVRVYPQVGPLQLARGIYVVEEVVRWTYSDHPSSADLGTPEGEFTIRLTYTVE